MREGEGAYFVEPSSRTVDHSSSAPSSYSSPSSYSPTYEKGSYGGEKAYGAGGKEGYDVAKYGENGYATEKGYGYGYGEEEKGDVEAVVIVKEKTVFVDKMSVPLLSFLFELLSAVTDALCR